MRRIAVIGSRMDLGAVRKGVGLGPVAIRKANLIGQLESMGFEVVDYGDVVPLESKGQGSCRMRYAEQINEANSRLYGIVLESLGKGYFPVVLGGDHSIAAASASASLATFKDVGIIWIDAHADFNDEMTTPSGNVHGMPLSAICGYGPDSMVGFCHDRAKPSRVVIVGARSIDSLERGKLERCGVTVFSMGDIHRLGISEVMENAIEIAGGRFHLSFDLDCLDPSIAPGVGTPVPDGISVDEMLEICRQVKACGGMVSMDIVEDNPLLDVQNSTGCIARDIVLASV